MSESKLEEINDEINIKEIFLVLWRGKYIIFLIVVLAVILSSLYLRNSERTYSIEVILKPVIEANSGPNLSGFSGLASLAGVSLPTSDSSDFKTYQELIFSEEVATRVFANKDLMRTLFKSEWSMEAKSFREPEPGRISRLLQVIKATVTGVDNGEYIPPNPKRLAMLMSRVFRLFVDKNTGFLSISTETAAPSNMIKLISITSQETDNLLKERFYLTAEDTLEFYYQKLLTSRSPEHREALAKLISVEDQKLMLASKSTNFVAELLTTPIVSLYPTSPRASLILTYGLVLGIFFGAAFALVKHAITTPKGN